ncbi:hypothetical protein D030_0036A, partial [Vibrio parahaemolyticus AQ3810]
MQVLPTILACYPLQDQAVWF